MSQTQRNYAKGVFMNRIGSTGMIGMDIVNVDQFITWLKGLPKDGTKVRLTIAEQKGDSNKFSIWENDFKPKAKQSNGSFADTTDDLPF